MPLIRYGAPSGARMLAGRGAQVTGPASFAPITATGSATSSIPAGNVIVTLNQVETGIAAGTYPFTAAVRLLPGAVPSGFVLQSPDDPAMRAAVLTTHADGSAQLAVVGGSITVAAGGAGSVRIQATSGSAGTALTAARIATLAPTASVLFNGGVSTTVALNPSSAPTRVWWASPAHVCASWTLPVPGTASLCVVYVVHAWAGSDRMQVEVKVENSLVNLASPADFVTASYTATVTIGGVVVRTVDTATAPEGDHRGSRAWYASGWIGGSQSIRVVMPHTYLQTLPEFWRQDQSSSFDFAGYAGDTYVPWGNGRIAATNMGGTGDVPGIGPLPQWECRTLQSGDFRGWRATEASALSALSYNINTRDSVTGLIPTFAAIGTRFQGSGWPRFDPTGSGGGVRGWEVAHAPDAGLLAFYGRATPVFIEIAQKAAVWCGTKFGGFSFPITWQAGVAGGFYQTRGKAWCIRAIAHATLVTPTDMAWKAAGATAIERNVALLEGFKDDPRNPLGYVWYLRPDRIGDFSSLPGLQQPMWMHHFLCGVLHRAERAMGHLLGANQARLSALADWACAQPARFINESTGGEWRFIPYIDTCGNSNIDITNGSPEGSGIYSQNFMTQSATWGAQRAAHYAGPVPPMAGRWRTHPGTPQQYTTGWEDDLVAGYYYVEPFMDALTCAVERGVSGAATAYGKVLANITNFAEWRLGYASDPRFGSVPRSGFTQSGWADGTQLGSLVGNVWTPGRNGNGDVTAASKGTLQVGRIYEVAGTALNTLDAPVKAAMLALTGQPWTDRSAQGWQGVSDAWVGWAIDERPGKWQVFIGPGGGHQASSNNGMYRFPLLKMSWAIQNLPTPSHLWVAGYFGDTVYPPALAAFEANPTGPVFNDQYYNPANPTSNVWKPTSRHTYQSMFVRPDEGADGTIYMLCRRAWKYDIATDTWAQPKNNRGLPRADTAISFENMFCWWDEVRGRAYHVGHGLSGTPEDRHFWWDGGNTWGTDFPGGTWPAGGYPLSYTAWERRGRVVHMIRYRHQNIPGGGSNRPGEPFRIRRVNLDTGGFTDINITFGASLAGTVWPSEEAQQYWDFGGVTYVPRLDRYIAIARRVGSVGDGDELAVINATTGVCELASTVYSGVLTPIGTNENKIRYFEDLDLVLIQPNQNRLMRVLVP
jgi:hypothetical protein